MTTKRTLTRALNAIDEAQTRLRRARDEAEDDTDIRRALSELEDAEADIRKAIRALAE